MWRRARRADGGDDGRLEHDPAGEVTLRVERGGAGKSELRRWLDRLALELRGRTRDRAAAALALRVGDADQHEVGTLRGVAGEGRRHEIRRAIDADEGEIGGIVL